MASGQPVDLARVELEVRAAVLRETARRLESVLNRAGLALGGCGSRKGTQTREVISMLGPLQLRRDYFHGWTGQGEQRGVYPLDEALGLIGRYTPGAARLISRLAAQMTFAELEDTLKESAGLSLDPRGMHRLLEQTAPRMAGARREQAEPLRAGTTLYLELDGTGIPMRKDELAGRPGRQADGSARTREVKLGAVFTQQGVDEDGHPLRDPESTTYVGTLDDADEVARLLRAEIQRRGGHAAVRMAAIADGAPWIWERFRQIAPDAIMILDFYHAGEHLTRLARALDGENELAVERRCARWRDALKQSRLQLVLDEAIAARPRHGPRRDAVDAEIAYFENNRSRMDYLSYRQAGLYFGSGVVEAGCKTVIGSRLKQSGMFWSESGAQGMLGLRCIYKSGLFSSAWINAYPMPLPVAS